MTARNVRRPFLAAGRGWHLALVHWRLSLAAWGASLLLAATGALLLAAPAAELSRRPALDEWTVLPPVTPSPLVEAATGGLPANPLALLQAALSAEGIRHLSAIPSPGRTGLPALVVVLLSALVAGPLVLALAAGRLGAPGETISESLRRRVLPYLVLAAGSLATIAVAYGLVVVGAGIVVDRTLPAAATERWIATATILRWGAFLLSVLVVGRVVGVTRARLAVPAPPRLSRALGEALAVSFRHPIALAATGVATLLPALLLFAVAFEAAGFGVSPPLLGPLPTLVVAQLLLVARQFQKVALLAADVEFCRRLAAAPESRLVRIEVAEAAPPRADRRSAWRLLSPRRPPAPAFVVPTTISGWSGIPAGDRREAPTSPPAEPPADMLGRISPSSLPTLPPTDEAEALSRPSSPPAVDPTAWSATIDGIDRENEIAAQEEALALERPVDLTGPPTIAPPIPSDEIFVPHEATLAARAAAEAPQHTGRRFGRPELLPRFPRLQARMLFSLLSRRIGRRIARAEPAAVPVATHWEPLLHDQGSEAPNPSEARIDVLAASRRREDG